MSRIKVLSLLLALSLVLTGCSGKKADTLQLYSSASTTSIYNTTQVVKGDFIKEQSYQASVYFPVQKELTFQSDGQMVFFSKYLVHNNEEVKKGTPLIEFNIDYDDVALADKKLKLKRAQEDYKTNLPTYEKAVSDAQADYDSMKDGYEKDTQKITLKKKKLEYDQYIYDSEENITQLKKDLSDYESMIAANQLCAPFDGIVVAPENVNVKRDGDYVMPTDILAAIYSEDDIQFQVSDTNRVLRYNMEVSINFIYGSDKYSLKGRVVSDPNALTGASGNNLVTIEALDKPDKDIDWLKLDNITVTVSSVIMKDVLMADLNAVYMKDGIAYVKVQEGDTIHTQNVIFADKNDDNYWILQGVEEGQTLIMK